MATGQHRYGRLVFPGARGYRRSHRACLRLYERGLGHRGHGAGDLSDRATDLGMRRALWAGHGSAYARRRLRLPGLDPDLADLRHLHLHLLRARSCDHGAGNTDGPGLATGGLLRRLCVGGDSDGAVWHHLYLALAGMDSAAVGTDAAGTLPVAGVRAPSLCTRDDRPCRPGLGQLRLQLAVLRLGLYGDLCADCASGRAGGLPALHAPAHARQPLALVDLRAAGRPRLDLDGYGAHVGWCIPGLCGAAVRIDRGAGIRPHAPLSRCLLGDAGQLRRSTMGHTGVRGRRADQDQRYQRLCRLARLVQRVLAPHPQPPRSRRLAGVQRDDCHADHDARGFQRTGEGAGHLQQYCGGLGGRAGG